MLVSLQISITALALGTLVGLPSVAWLATEQFRGKRALIIMINPWIVGCNILNSTRTMIASIALETSKGNLPLALALGIVLLANLFTFTVRSITEPRYG